MSTISIPLLKERCRQITGSGLAKIKQIMGGESNQQVYLFKTKNGSEFFCKVSTDLTKFLTEQWIINQVKKVEVPAPEILSIQNVDIGSKNFSLCIQQKAPGKPLEKNQSFQNLSSNRQRRILGKIGELLSRIHSIPLSGLGIINAPHKNQFLSWYDYLESRQKKIKMYYEIVKNNNISSLVLGDIFKVYLQNAPQAATQICLNHGDFATKHIFTKSNRITGIIDWGEACGSSPFHDIANWFYWFDNQYPTIWLLDGYPNLNHLDNWQEKIRWHLLDISFDLLEHYSNTGHKIGVESTLKRLLADSTNF